MIMLSAISDFLDMIKDYLAEARDTPLFIGGASAAITILIGMIMFDVQVKVNKTTGRNLVLSGIVLANIIEYFVLFPPEFVIG